MYQRPTPVTCQRDRPSTSTSRADLWAQLAGINVANEEPNRRALREMLFRAEGIENYIRCPQLHRPLMPRASQVQQSGGRHRQQRADVLMFWQLCSSSLCVPIGT